MNLQVISVLIFLQGRNLFHYRHIMVDLMVSMCLSILFFSLYLPSYFQYLVCVKLSTLLNLLFVDKMHTLFSVFNETK